MPLEKTEMTLTGEDIATDMMRDLCHETKKLLSPERLAQTSMGCIPSNKPSNYTCKKRLAGLYWVKIDGTLTIAQHDGGNHLAWSLIGSDDIFCDADIDEIGTIVPQPNKNWRN